MKSLRRATSGGFLLRCASLTLLILACVSPARAMRILLTNDDGFESNNLQVLYTALKAAGHDVILSAPYLNQSGASAQVGNFTSVPPTTRASSGGRIAAGAPGIGPTGIAPDQYYVDSSPAAAAVYGIVGPAQTKWGGPPDLVISGPNIGTNLGIVTPHSGTVGAVVTVLNRGVPALAVNGPNGNTATAPLLAAITLRFVAALDNHGKANLPRGIGLNINVPNLDSTRTPESYPIAFTLLATGPEDETTVYAGGTKVTASPIQGTYEAPPASAADVLMRMQSLFSTAAAIKNPQLTNISTRLFVGADSDAPVAGFTVSGNTTKTVLIRASGPALAQFGVTRTLDDPIIQLYDSSNNLVATNDNWGDDVSKAFAIANAATRVGAFGWPLGSKDAALLIALPPGAYTVVIRGVGNTTGTALIEVYDAKID